MADTLFTTMGLYWREDWVFWGRPRNAGQLLGVPANNVTAPPTEFRDQMGVYVLYAEYSLVYVGQTGSGNQRLFARLKQHRKDDLAGRWNRFSWFGIRRVKKNNELSPDVGAVHPPLKTVLDQIEGLFIHAAEPPLNGQGGRLRASVKRYIQVRNPETITFEQAALIQLCKKEGVDVNRLQRLYLPSFKSKDSDEE
jgi:hypothetical protein